MRKRNGELGGRLTLMLRMLKSWNRQCEVGLRSFHLEGLAVREIEELHGYWPIEMLRFLDEGVHTGAGFLSIPAHHGAIDALTDEEPVAWHVRQGVEAAQRRDLESAMSSFRAVLGDAFPQWGSLAATYGY